MQWNERVSLLAALFVHFAALLSCTLVGAADGDWNWSTVSDMITRGDGRLSKAFAVAVCGCVIIQAALVYAIVTQRPSPPRWVWFPFFVAAGAQIAFAIVSLDVDTKWHERLAVLAFGCLYLVSVALSWTQPHRLIDLTVWGLIIGATGGLGFLLDGAYYYEYILMWGIHVVFAGLIVQIPVDVALSVRIKHVHGFVKFPLPPEHC